MDFAWLSGPQICAPQKGFTKERHGSRLTPTTQA